MDCVSPAFLISLRYSLPAYRLPLSECWIRPGTGPLRPQGHRQGITAKLGPHVILHRPTNDFPRGHVFHTRQTEPPFIRIDISDIGQPNRIGGEAVELLFQQVWRRAHLVIAVRCHGLAALVQAWRHLVFLLDPRHPPLGDGFAIGHRVLMDPL